MEGAVRRCRRLKAPWVHCKIEIRVKHVADFVFFICCKKMPKILMKIPLQLQHRATIVDTQKKKNRARIDIQGQCGNNFLSKKMEIVYIEGKRGS
jgi:hypothetical protein